MFAIEKIVKNQFPKESYHRIGIFFTLAAMFEVHSMSIRPTYTVWKFHDFSITEILREINIGVSRSTKSAILTHLEALNLDFKEFLHFLKAAIDKINKILRAQK